MDRLSYEIRDIIAVYVALPSVEQDYAIARLLNKPPYKSKSSDLKNLRLVNWAFAKVVPDKLYSEVIVIPDAASMERLRLICEHPTYSSHVRTVRYKSNVVYHPSYPGTPINPEHPPVLFDGADNWLGHEPPWGICWLHPVHPVHEHTGAIVWRFGYDACTVAMLLRRIPRLDKLTINEIECRNCDSEETLGAQSQALISGLYNAGINLKNLECLFVLRQIEQLQPQELLRVHTIFSNLRTLCLTLRMDWLSSHEFPHGDDYLSEFISKATNLHSLVVLVDADPNDDLSLSELVGNRVWPHLQEFVLDNFHMGENDLVNFAARHVDTLQILSLGNVHLYDGYWNSTLSRLRSTVQLHEFHSSGAWSTYPVVDGRTRDRRVQAYNLNSEGQIVKAEGYDLAMAIRTYVLHGGSFDIQQWPIML